MHTHLTDELISGYLDELITDEEVRFVKRHVAQCQQCAERLAQFSLLDETIAEMDTQSVEDAVFQQVRTRVLREVARQQRDARRIRVPWWSNLFSTRALAYATVALVLIGSVVFFTPEQSGVIERSTSRGKGGRLSSPGSPTQVASAAQLEFYQKATGILTTTAKEAYSSASEEAQSLSGGSRAFLAAKIDQLSETSSVLLASAKTKASHLREAAGDQGSGALVAAAKQALPQAGISAGTTLIQLLGAMG